MTDEKRFREFCNDLNYALRQGEVFVTFLKKDGTEREMRCTLKTEDVKQYEKKTERTKTVNEDVCAVFDLDKQEWRSFRYDSVKFFRQDVFFFEALV